ncbi:HypC/HybG/HupF family hydrogenase formation chaperone [Pelolinea submarina]|uniref:Hydrogenase maturation protein HypC n=1 Tax=Pelolinea submarina TaxID=913107 RepID=A0A347ZTR5_9CHLR|nr:HypC/HybG/HupF family hydrogenase formation chaperone [Pelolinea submarina]REG10723.1 hydrogenase maturation protein HypC [Pelolinea submarina]BBB48696.1 hydrogenase expression/formation protein HypC [Pelolinea submarina]
MCLGIPGKIIEITTQEGTRMGKIDFDGVELEVCLEATPEAKLGDYVIVHAGFAISTMSESEAKETLDLLAQIESLQEESES